MKKNYYDFDRYMDFTHGIEDFATEEFLQVYPNPIVINDDITALMFSAYGIESDNFKSFNVSISDGNAKVIPQLFEHPEMNSMDYLIHFISDTGSITLTDTHDTYTFHWKRIDPKTYMLTSYDNIQIIWDGQNATPVNMNDYQQRIIDLYNTLPKDLEDVDTTFFDNFKAYLFKKLQQAENEKN